MGVAKVKGIEAVLKNLNKALEGVEIRTLKGMTASVLLVKADSVRMTPVDTSNLRGSAYAHAERWKGKIYGIIGYTAHYAAAVHEMSGKLKGLPRGHFGKTRAGLSFGGGTKKGRYWDPQGQARPQFLRVALQKNIRNIIKLIRDEAKIK